MNIVYNMDCMEYLKSLPDRAFDLAVVDPPYGGGTVLKHGKVRSVHVLEEGLTGIILKVNNAGGVFSPEISMKRTGGTWAAKYGENISHWDVAPQSEYFTELFRVSVNQIIWGGNYFNLPPTRCFVIWKKKTISAKFSMAMAEYAWTSFNRNAKVYEYAPQGTKKDPRIHPTQKPVGLYKDLLKEYAKPGDRILDTHVGSGSSRIACYELGYDFAGCEIDKVYFDLQEKRFERYLEEKNEM